MKMPLSPLLLICIVKVLSGLHAKCDQYGTQILRRFISQKQLEKFLRTIRWSRSQQKSDSGDFAVELDPRQVSLKPSCIMRDCGASREQRE